VRSGLKTVGLTDSAPRRTYGVARTSGEDGEPPDLVSSDDECKQRRRLSAAAAAAAAAAWDAAREAAAAAHRASRAAGEAAEAATAACSPATSEVAGSASAPGGAAAAAGRAPPTTVAERTQTRPEDGAAVRDASGSAPSADARCQARALAAPVPASSASAATATPAERPGPHYSRGLTSRLRKSRPTPPSPCVVPLYPPGIPQRDGGGYRAPARDVAHSPQGKANERTGHLRRGKQRD